MHCGNSIEGFQKLKEYNLFKYLFPRINSLIKNNQKYDSMIVSALKLIKKLIYLKNLKKFYSSKVKIFQYRTFSNQLYFKYGVCRINFLIYHEKI